MANSQLPGYLLEPEIVRTPAQTGSPTAMPVFLGYVAQLQPSQLRVPVLVTRMAEFARQFGTVGESTPWANDAPQGSLAAEGPFLERNLNLYFLNGGGPCYVLPVGEAQPGRLPSLEDFEAVEEAIDRVQGITLVLPTDAALLPLADHQSLCRRLLASCAGAVNRFCILDACDAAGGAGVQAPRAFVEGLGHQALAHGAAYAPLLRVPSATGDGGQLRRALPSGAVAAAYATTDQTRGMWNAPANVAITGVVGLAETLSLADMGALYEPADGRGVNMIRSIHGRGIYIWGARTLAGQDPEWQHVQVRRLMSYVEASLRERTLFAVFETNTLRTWLVMKGLCESLLKELWEAGGLAGERKEEAFQVVVGLGESMTEADIAEGRLIVIIRMAPKRPAEFISLKLFHQVQVLGNQ